MDSFSEPYTRQGDDISLDQVRANIDTLEQQHKKNGITLSGRIIHVCHYLPIIATLNSRPTSSILSPPPTPPTKPLDPDARAASESAEPAATSPWSLAARYGHAAMISGIRSLSSSHEQIVIGWTGDILAPPPSSTSANASASASGTITAGADKVPAGAISQADKAAFQDALDGYKIDPEDDRGEKRAKYVPVWLDDKVAHGHYDGYCKQSEIRLLLSFCFTQSSFGYIALWPLFHYLLWQDVATEYASADSHYPYYESANAAFARRIAEVYQPGDIVWVHDYHLLLLPR